VFDTATSGWYWAVDLLQELGATVHLANPRALSWGDRRVKNDVIDAAVMAKEGALPRRSDMFGPAGNRQLDQLELGEPFVRRVRSLRQLIAAYDRESAALERQIHPHPRGHRGDQAVQAINGIGPISAGVLMAEIGDVSRFPTPAHLCAWVGLTPRYRESISRRGGGTSPTRRTVGACCNYCGVHQI
jgi:transposase